MDNIIEFPTRVIKEEEEVDLSLNFIQNYLIPWATESGLDINSMTFKLNGATIMTCIQGMLLDDI
jgi:hypothetical protein